ncbi:MAG: NAD-dependent epimerase/dehydratase family protein [Candidatus Diapherotrites archaeon]|uniref:NAD-dependent epimerase/dehydratase family protein n=1 Tax=Candidatus Iainarchaeum sp. TaxID=3101447 RepID=A0A7J4IXS4_9ARCH|nr:MAG: UDP-glucose 4-epimerase [archaeon GW2011_AR10]MBS3059300.1 NAD-dependent epimerase/dehydratase family protein [Candidatus Diapherotrites archaeon]HIH07766.1 NAD-dependent epimerase/dehydratase family protein [Candidatus Diapherotrites archaeon]
MKNKKIFGKNFYQKPASAKKFFVTGGAGFIGGHLVERLLEGNSVTVYDNLSSGRKEFLEKCDGKKNFSFVKADLLDFSRLQQEMKGHDFVWHLSANPDILAGMGNPELDLKQGTIASFNVLEAMRLNNVKQIAFSSTSAVYGEPTVFPTPENYGPMQPISFYAASKLASEALITAYAHNFGWRSWIFRFANIVGRRATHGVIFDFIEKLKKNRDELLVLGNGKQKKSYVYADELIDAMLFAVESSREQVNLFNIASKDNISVKEIAEIVLKKAGLSKTKIKYTGTERGWPGDVTFMNLDASQLGKLGWNARLSSRQAVERTVVELLKELDFK